MDTNFKEIKNEPSALLRYISTQEFFRTPEKCGEARAKTSAKRTSQMFLKIPKYLLNLKMLEEQVLKFFL